MFKNKKTSISLNGSDTLIGEGTTFEGKITSSASIRIEGTVIGDISCEGDAIIGEKGEVKSDIVTARNVIIAGKVVGNIDCDEKLTITSLGALNGNITVGSLIVEEGGLFQGMSKMQGKSQFATE